jgi:hypothetical protein
MINPRKIADVKDNDKTLILYVDWEVKGHYFCEINSPGLSKYIHEYSRDDMITALKNDPFALSLLKQSKRKSDLLNAIISEL